MIYWEYYSLTVIDYELTHQQAPTNQCSVSRSQELQVRLNHNQTIRNKLLNYKNTNYKPSNFPGFVFFSGQNICLNFHPIQAVSFLCFSLTKVFLWLKNEKDSCWSGWSRSPYLFWLIAAPMLAAYMVSYHYHYHYWFIFYIIISYYLILMLAAYMVSHHIYY